jgi:hypothetical protein
MIEALILGLALVSAIALGFLGAMYWVMCIVLKTEDDRDV